LIRKYIYVGVLLSVLLVPGAAAQEQNAPGQESSGQESAPQDAPALEEILKEALAVHIQAKISQDIQQVMWQSEVNKLTIPGRPVTLHLRNEQARLSVHFTPYRTVKGGLILVAQSEVWLVQPGDETSPDGLRYFTSMKSIPLDFGEQVVFYPLGKLDDLDNPEELHIQMIVMINPYALEEEVLEEEAAPEGSLTGENPENNPETVN